MLFVFRSSQGGGKTTVVSALVVMLLGDGRSLVTQVMPQALLEFSRSILRSRFSAIIFKPVYTFNFDRFQGIQPDLYRKLLKGMLQTAVRVAA
jgi:hypothetical protein